MKGRPKSKGNRISSSLLYLSLLPNPGTSYIQPLVHNTQPKDAKSFSPIRGMLIHDIHLSLISPSKIQGALTSQLQWSSATTTVPLRGLLPWETGLGLASHLNRHISSLNNNNNNFKKASYKHTCSI